MSNLYTISTCLISNMKKLTYEKLPSSKVNIIRLKKKKKSFGLTQILCIMSFLLASSHTSAGETNTAMWHLARRLYDIIFFVDKNMYYHALFINAYL